MKIDRLYAITVYLLNHCKATTTELSRKYEVSVRTIQRDIDSLCQAVTALLLLKHTIKEVIYHGNNNHQKNADALWG
jgi:predicted DNA-binding transcriptional regulator YafY